MNICLCIKQVPDTREMKFDPERNVLIREDLPRIVNPYDLQALEMALQIREVRGGKITLVSMGPKQAAEAIKTCLEIGADQGFLVSGRAFAGADTYSTSYILARAIRTIEKRNKFKFDLILCGNQAIDGATGQVGAELAERLHMPQLTRISDLLCNQNTMLAKRDCGKGYDLLEFTLPALLTILKANVPPRCATLKTKMLAKHKEIILLSEEDIEGLDMNACGIKGSPTRVVATYSMLFEQRGYIVKNENKEKAVELLVDRMKKDGVLKYGKSTS